MTVIKRAQLHGGINDVEPAQTGRGIDVAKAEGSDHRVDLKKTYRL